MKNFIRQTLATAILFVVCINADAQTNVSGGIYANTTWTLANSPYIVTANLTVFPGNTLTIEPGVVIKLDSAVTLEIRQSNLYAIGTITDSITFLSAAPNWGMVYLNGIIYSQNMHVLNYCNFRHLSTGLSFSSSTTYDTLIIKNSNFNYNVNALRGGNNSYMFVDSCNFNYNSGSGYSGGSMAMGIFNHCDFSHNNIGIEPNQYITVKNSKINFNITGVNMPQGITLINCVIRHNTWGINNSAGYILDGCQIDFNTIQGADMQGGDSLVNCKIRYNGIGLADHGWNQTNIVTQCEIEHNTIGLHIEGLYDKIYCNKICNNTSYDFYYNGTPNFDATNNYWCATDSVSLEGLIYDGYDNLTYGLVDFMPLDTAPCYSDTSTSFCSTSFTLYPGTSTPHNWFVIADVTVSPFEYTWDWGDGNSSTGAYPSHTYDSAGYYNICLTIVDSTTCTFSYCDTSTYLYKTEATMVTINVVDQLPSGVNDLTATVSSLIVFPNPSSGSFTLTLPPSSNQLNIYNTTGQLVQTQQVKNKTTLNLELSETGIYFVQVITDKEIVTEKVVVSR